MCKTHTKRYEDSEPENTGVKGATAGSGFSVSTMQGIRRHHWGPAPGQHLRHAGSGFLLRSLVSPRGRQLGDQTSSSQRNSPSAISCPSNHNTWWGAQGSLHPSPPLGQEAAGHRRKSVNFGPWFQVLSDHFLAGQILDF